MSGDRYQPSTAIAVNSKRRPWIRLPPRARAGILVAAAAALVILVLGPLRGSVRHGYGHLIMIVAPAIAAAACFNAGRVLPAQRRAGWRWFAGAAAVAALGQLLAAAGEVALRTAHSYASAGQLFALLFYPLFCVGAAIALRATGGPRRGAEVTLDGALIAAAGAALMIRLGLEPLLARPGLGTAELYGLLAGLLGSLAALCLAALSVLDQASSVSGRAAAALLGAAAAFGLGHVLHAVWPAVNGEGPGGPNDLPLLGGWALLTYAGVISASEASQRTAQVAKRVARRGRQAVLPAAALLLGVLGLDAALRSAVSVDRGFSLAVLGALLAVRSAYALRAVERQTEEYRRLSHTRALVEVSHALACSTELDRTLQLVAHWAARLLNARGAGIELLTEDGESLELRAAYGLPPHVLGILYPVEGSFTGWVVRHGRTRATIDPSQEPLIQPESRDFLGNTPVAAAPLLYRGRPLGALFACARERPFDENELELLRALADQAAIAIENARLFEQVRTLSLTDPLTGLANRRQLERELAREFAAARRGRKLVAVVFDLDNFKKYNDGHGHLAGDEVLRIFGSVLAQETRAMNMAARYGGDEFVALLSDSTRERAMVFIERVRERFHERLAELGRTGITASAGVAEYHPSMPDPHALIAAADQALYQAKAAREQPQA